MTNTVQKYYSYCNAVWVLSRLLAIQLITKQCKAWKTIPHISSMAPSGKAARELDGSQWRTQAPIIRWFDGKLCPGLIKARIQSQWYFGIRIFTVLYTKLYRNIQKYAERVYSYIYLQYLLNFLKTFIHFKTALNMPIIHSSILWYF